MVLPPSLMVFLLCKNPKACFLVGEVNHGRFFCPRTKCLLNQPSKLPHHRNIKVVQHRMITFIWNIIVTVEGEKVSIITSYFRDIPWDFGITSSGEK